MNERPALHELTSNGQPATSNVNGDLSELADLMSRISSELEAGQSIDWDQLRVEYPEYAQELEDIKPALDCLRVLRPDNDPNFATTPIQADTSERRRLGDFEIIREIGRGGMGIVYEAQQVSIHRQVALKVLPLASLIDERALKRFHNEVRAAASLEHPNIVWIYSVGEECGVHYYTMRLVHGQSLAAVIQSQQQSNSGTVAEFKGCCGSDSTSNPQQPASRYDENAISDTGKAQEIVAKGRSGTEPDVAPPSYYREAARLGAQAATALQHAHERGVVHRDIKPGNLLIDKQGELFVTDFGLARIEADAGLTLSGDLLGTLRYMSPEQVVASQGIVDHRTGIYSLGATIYEMLTLEPMIGGHERGELLRQISFEDPIPLRKINPGVPADLETIVLKATNKEPGDRYESAQAFADDLGRFLDNKPIDAKRTSLTQRLAKWTRRNPAIVVSALLVLFVTTASLAVSNVLILKQKKIADKKTTEARKQTIIADEKSAEAQRERDFARSITDFVKDDFLALTTLKGQMRFGAANQEYSQLWRDKLARYTTLRELLDRAADKLSARTDLAPLIKAELYWIIGMSYYFEFDFQRSVSFLERSVALYKENLGEDDRETLNAQNSLAVAYPDLRSTDAIRLLTDILPRARTAIGNDDVLTLQIISNLGTKYLDDGQSKNAINFLEQVVNSTSDENLVFAEALGPLSTAYVAAGRKKEVAELVDQHVETITGFDPSETPWLGRLLDQLALSLMAVGNYKRAEQLLRIRLDICDEFTPDDWQAPNTRSMLGESLLGQGRFDEAEPLLIEGFEGLRRRAVYHRYGLQPNIVQAINRLIDLYRQSQRPKDAERWFAKLPDIAPIGPGDPVFEFAIYGNESGGKFGHAGGLAINKVGHIFVADLDNGCIQIFDKRGKFLRTLGRKGTAPGEFNAPLGVRFDQHGNLFVSDQRNHRVQVFDTVGKFKFQFGSFGKGNGQFRFVGGITVLDNGDIYACDRLNHRVQVFDNLGNFRFAFGKFGNGPNEFNGPGGMNHDSEGNIYVGGFRNHRVQVFDMNGNFLHAFGSYGTGDGQFNSPGGVTVQGECVYVTDQNNHRVQVFDRQGNFKFTFGSFGESEGRFNSPMATAMDGSGRIFTTELLNNRVQAFRLPQGPEQAGDY